MTNPAALPITPTDSDVAGIDYRRAAPFGPLVEQDGRVAQWLRHIALAGSWGPGATVSCYDSRGRFTRCVTVLGISYVSDDDSGATTDYVIDCYHTDEQGRVRRRSYDGAEYGYRWRIAPVD